MRIGYLKQFISLFGVRYGIELYLKISFNRMDKIKIPQLKHPISLRKNTSDLKVFFQIFVNKEYDINMGFIPNTTIDGGANIGLFSVFLANKYPDCQIIAIEPEDGNYQQLLKNTEHYSTISCLKSGIWNKDTYLKIENVQSDSWGFVTVESEDGGIKALKIDTIMQQYNFDRIDVLKLDIESSEKEVFEGEYQKWLPNCKILIVELHDLQKQGCSRAFFEAVNSSIINFQYDIIGENTVIYNHSLKS